MNKQPKSAMHGDYRDGDTHEPFRSLLPAFAMVCLEGSVGGTEWNRLETHLDGCAACRAELEDLLQLLDATYHGILETEITLPVPDLAYLPPWATPERPHELVAVVRTVTTAIRHIVIQFTEMLAIAMQQPAPAGGFRSGAQAEENNAGATRPTPPSEYTYQFQGPSPDDVVVAVDFALVDSDHQHYRVKVTVVDQDQDPFSQGGHRVTVQYEAQTSEAITDASGCAAFQGIPYAALPELQITISLRSTA